MQTSILSILLPLWVCQVEPATISLEFYQVEQNYDPNSKHWKIGSLYEKIRDRDGGIVNNTLPYLDMFGQTLETIPENFFMDDHWLEHIWGYIPPKMYSERKTATSNEIITLNLERCKLREVARPTFHTLTSLKILLLSMNEIETVPENAFQEVIDLELLDVSQNSLVNVNEKAFMALRNLKILDLSDNRLQKIDKQMFVQTPLLQYLSLKMCEFEDPCHEMLTTMPAIKYISLAENYIERITTGCFGQSSTLEVLDLHSNHIVLIDEGAFGNLPELKIMNLSTNDLSTLPKNMCQGLPKVEEIDLLTNVNLRGEICIIQQCPSLRTITIGDSSSESIGLIVPTTENRRYVTNILLSTNPESLNKVTLHYVPTQRAMENALKKPEIMETEEEIGVVETVPSEEQDSENLEKEEEKEEEEEEEINEENEKQEEEEDEIITPMVLPQNY